MRRRIDLGEALAALGAVLLLVSLFLDWYDGVTGWEAFESLDLVVLLAALAVLAVAAGAFDWLGARLLAPLGLLLLVIVVVQMVEPPPVMEDRDLDSGAWLAVGGAALVLLGGALRTSSISVTVNVGGKDARRRVPAVDRRQDAAPAAPAAPAVDEPTQATQPFSALEDPPPSP